MLVSSRMKSNIAPGTYIHDDSRVKGGKELHPLFEIRHLRKRHWKKGGEEVADRYIVLDLSTAIAQPDRIALVGASGQGKSTLLRMLALLEPADGGELLLKGHSCTSMHTRQWRQKVCYVAQQAIMLPGSVEDNLRTVSRLHGTAYDAKLVRQLLDRCGLGGMDLDKRAEDCSGGEKQRISLIRSLLLRPEVLLLDEITASLDVSSTQKIEELLQYWHATEGTSYIWVTHDLEQAGRISSTAWFLNQGMLMEQPSHELVHHPPEALARKVLEFADSEDIS